MWLSTLNKSFQTLPANPLVGSAGLLMQSEVEAMKKAEYMEDYVGEEYDAVVSSVVKFGLFVELPNTVEGLIHITNLPEFYHFNERDLTLRGEKFGVTFRRSADPNQGRKSRQDDRRD